MLTFSFIFCKKSVPHPHYFDYFDGFDDFRSNFF